VASKEVQLAIEPREKLGTTGSNALRRSGKIPAIVYGHGTAADNIAFDAHAFEEVLHHSGRNAIITLTVGSKKQTAMVRELQTDPISRRIVHVDLQRVTANEAIVARLPVVTTGVADGVRNMGAVMDVIAHEIEVEGPANKIPENVEVDVTALGVHDHVTAGNIPLPAGFKLITPPDTVIVTIEPSRTAQDLEQAATPAEQAEPQVIGAEPPTPEAS
jgi:large subunit ribosomal protein L25